MEPVFICGIYKCGTSWLLSALSAHPDVTGLREIDIVKSACDLDESGHGALAPVSSRMGRFFGRSSWCRVPAKAAQELETGTFGGPGSAESYESIDARAAVARLADLGKRIERDDVRQVPVDARPKTFFDLPEHAAASLIERIRSAAGVHEALDAMIEVHGGVPQSSERIS